MTPIRVSQETRNAIDQFLIDLAKKYEGHPIWEAIIGWLEKEIDDVFIVKAAGDP